MVNSSKRKTSLWYGYLKAGARSSPVLRDARLDTGNPMTLYIFNLMRGEILEYARAIVEKKLRELKSSESGFIAELDVGYKNARCNFKGRGAGIPGIRARAVHPFREKKEQVDGNAINEIILDDIDMWLDAEDL